jgi:amino-acid N-acetyltransferase
VQELIMAILSSQATRRDAKSYFGRFGTQDSGTKVQGQASLSSATAVKPSESIHIAIVKLCHADSLPSVGILPGLAKTFVQLGRLGMHVCLVVEPEDSYSIIPSSSPWNAASLREKYGNLTNRVVEAIEAQGGRAQPMLGELLTQVDSIPASSRDKRVPCSDTVTKIERLILGPPVAVNPIGKQLLYDLMKRGQIPVVAPVAGGINPSLLPVSADSVLYRLCNGISASNDEDSPLRMLVERVMIFDPIGGLPAADRRGGSHVYVNLRQEYDGIVNEISSRFLTNEESSSAESGKMHLRNLILIRMCLAELNATSSGLITTPTIASASPSQSTPQSLIHNLLTDKPLISPSLPHRQSRTPISNTTLLRTGLPVTVYNSVDPTGDEETSLDVSRLVRLIEDSFGRRLNVDHYLNRIRDKIAAVIVAGDYEGAAVITKESSADNLSGSWVPYLDKFAVSTKSQGSGGVADIVFNALISTFPNDLIWRSRISNPVNKWVLVTDITNTYN